MASGVLLSLISHTNYRSKLLRLWLPAWRKLVVTDSLCAVVIPFTTCSCHRSSRMLPKSNGSEDCSSSRMHPFLVRLSPPSSFTLLLQILHIKHREVQIPGHNVGSAPLSFRTISGFLTTDTSCHNESSLMQCQLMTTPPAKIRKCGMSMTSRSLFNLYTLRVH